MRSALTGLSLLLAGAPACAGVSDLRAAELAHLVHQDCGACHGMTLAGGLGPDIRPQALHGLSTEALTAVILEGRPGTAMPPWRPLLSDVEAEWIAHYLLEGPTP